MPPPTRPVDTAARRPGRRRLAAVLVAGLAISAVMVARSQVAGDQLDLLARGWLLAEQHRWVHYGQTTSADGKNPGGLTSLLAGLPLLVWRDYRAPAVLLLLSHLLAYGLLDAVVRRALGGRERFLFALLFWLNPWRLMHSAFLWNANWMFFFGALHLWTAWGQRRRASFPLSLLHGLALVGAFQTHAAFVILALASVLFLLRGIMRVSWAGAVTAGLLGAVSLLPWAREVAANPALLPGGAGFPGRGVLLVYPLLRGVMYWLRYPSLAVADRMAIFDFSALLGGSDRLLGPALAWAVEVVGTASVLLPLAANVWFWRRNAGLLRARFDPAASDRQWLHGAVVWTAVAALLSFALAPTTIMMWQSFAVLHAAVLPVVLYLGVLERSRVAAPAHRAVRALAAGFLVMSVAMAAGAPMFRRGGRAARRVAVHEPHPMLSDLGILAHTSARVDPASTWMPDVLRPDPASGR